MASAVWSTGTPVLTVDGDGTLHAAVPVEDAGALAVTVAFTLTTDRGLRVDVTSAPGVAGLSDFSAWSNT